MRKSNKLAICLGALALTVLLATPARANLQVCVIDSLHTACAGGSNTASTAGQSLSLSFSDSDFSTTLNIATSNHPGTTYAELTVDSTAQATSVGVGSTCLGCGNSTFGGVVGIYNLMILVSDNGFIQPVGPAMLTQNVNTNKPAIKGATGEASFSGYVVNSGAIFATGASPNEVGPATFSSFSNANNAAQSSGIYTTANPFTLTEILQLHLTNTGKGQATSNLDISGVPEPASILLLGTVLLGLGSLLRKRVS